MVLGIKWLILRDILEYVYGHRQERLPAVLCRGMNRLLNVLLWLWSTLWRGWGVVLHVLFWTTSSLTLLSENPAPLPRCDWLCGWLYLVCWRPSPSAYCPSTQQPRGWHWPPHTGRSSASSDRCWSTSSASETRDGSSRRGRGSALRPVQPVMHARSRDLLLQMSKSNENSIWMINFYFCFLPKSSSIFKTDLLLQFLKKTPIFLL